MNASLRRFVFALGLLGFASVLSAPAAAQVYLTQWGTTGTGNGLFMGPFAIATNAGGDVYVADYNNNRIQKFSGTGGYLGQWGSGGIGNGQFSNGPNGVATYANQVYVTDIGSARPGVHQHGSVSHAVGLARWRQRAVRLQLFPGDGRQRRRVRLGLWERPRAEFGPVATPARLRTWGRVKHPYR